MAQQELVALEGSRLETELGDELVLQNDLSPAPLPAHALAEWGLCCRASATNSMASSRILLPPALHSISWHSFTRRLRHSVRESTA